MDEHHHTKSYFNLSYDQGIFSDLYSVDHKQNSPEHYPIGTAIIIPSNTGKSYGYVLVLPTTPSSSTLHSDPLYMIQLLDSSTTTVPASAMDTFINRSLDPIQVTLPSWLSHDAKVCYTIGNITHQERLHLGSKNTCSFVVHNKLGSLIKQIQVDNLPFIFQTLISEDRL